MFRLDSLYKEGTYYDNTQDGSYNGCQVSLAYFKCDSYWVIGSHKRILISNILYAPY